VQKFEILFKFVYTERYLTENIGTVQYLTVETSTGRYLTGTISDINVYLFCLVRYGMAVTAGTVRYL